MSRPGKLISFVLLSLLPAVALASFRCPNGQLVQTGDSAYEVLANCGQPDYKEYTGVLNIGNRYVDCYQWVYDLGAGQFAKMVTVCAGTVTKIENGPRIQSHSNSPGPS